LGLAGHPRPRNLAAIIPPLNAGIARSLTLWPRDRALGPVTEGTPREELWLAWNSSSLYLSVAWDEDRVEVDCDLLTPKVRHDWSALNPFLSLQLASHLMILLLSASLILTGLVSDPFALKSGDQVAFYGDSITEQGHYTNLVEAAIATRFPSMKVRFVNLGWAGDTIYGTTGWEGAGGTPETRIKRDLLPENPTHIAVMLGMNDGWYSPYKAEWAADFGRNYEGLINKIHRACPRAQLTLMRTSPWDDITRPPSFPAGIKGEGGYNVVLRQYGEAVAQTAKKLGAGYVDQNEPLVQALTFAKVENAELAQKIIPDLIHPGPAGGLVMAQTLLRAWNFPTELWSITLDAATGRVVGQRGTTVIKFANGAWEQKDAGLPFPIDRTDPATALVARLTHAGPALGSMRLTVRGLPKPRYVLLIETKAVGEFTAAELAAGIDLAERDTPMGARSLEVWRGTVAINRLAFITWREVVRPFGNVPAGQSARKGLNDLQQSLTAHREALAQRTTFRYRLEPL